MSSVYIMTSHFFFFFANDVKHLCYVLVMTSLAPVDEQSEALQ